MVVKSIKPLVYDAEGYFYGIMDVYNRYAAMKDIDSPDRSCIAILDNDNGAGIYLERAVGTVVMTCIVEDTVVCRETVENGELLDAIPRFWREYLSYIHTICGETLFNAWDNLMSTDTPDSDNMIVIHSMMDTVIMLDKSDGHIAFVAEDSECEFYYGPVHDRNELWNAFKRVYDIVVENFTIPAA